MFDGQQLGEDVVALVRGFMEREIAPLKARIAELEAREPIAGPAGEKGDPGENGKDGEPGSSGQDGRGIKSLLIDREGELVATMDDGSVKSLGPVCGKDGEPGHDGADGKDGFGFEELDACVLDDDRTIELCFRRGEEEKAFTFKWPTCIYRNVFKEGEQYERGDMVTWAGSLWHCDQPTKDKPGTESWTLAAKKGRDGKDARG